MPLPLAGLAAIGSQLGGVGDIAGNVLGRIPGIGGRLKKAFRTPAHKRAERDIPGLVARAQQGDESAIAALQHGATSSATSKSKSIFARALSQIGAGNYSLGAGGGGGGGGTGGEWLQTGLGLLGAYQGAQSAGRAERAERLGTTDPGNPYGMGSVYRGGGAAARRAAGRSLGF